MRMSDISPLGLLGGHSTHLRDTKVQIRPEGCVVTTPVASPLATAGKGASSDDEGPLVRENL